MRHIFLFLDGTDCTLQTRTNIGQVYSLISDTETHRRYYQNGIGAFSRIKWIDNLLAPNVDQKVVEAYEALLPLNLSLEDRLYIFGYSRGAVIARRLAMCLASRESLVAISTRGLDFEKAVQAEVAYLCLFDPVIGWPRFFDSKFPDHDAVLEARIRSYVELISIDEARFLFPSDSYFASDKVRKKIESVSSISEAYSTADRESSFLELTILKTRKSIWFPGTHSDVGGHGKNKKIGAHALATSMEELLCILPDGTDRSVFNMKEISSLLQSSEDDITSHESNNGILRRFWRKFVKSTLLRAPTKRVLVQHLAHPTCIETGEATWIEGLPLYPTYSALAVSARED